MVWLLPTTGDNQAMSRTNSPQTATLGIRGPKRLCRVGVIAKLLVLRALQFFNMYDGCNDSAYNQVGFDGNDQIIRQITNDLSTAHCHTWAKPWSFYGIRKACMPHPPIAKRSICPCIKWLSLSKQATSRSLPRITGRSCTMRKDLVILI